MRSLLIIVAVLLGWFGMGGTESNTDVVAHVTGLVAHVTGLVAGAALGFGCGKLALPERLDSAGQAVLGAAALGLVVVAWAAALA